MSEGPALLHLFLRPADGMLSEQMRLPATLSEAWGCPECRMLASSRLCLCGRPLSTQNESRSIFRLSAPSLTFHSRTSCLPSSEILTTLTSWSLWTSESLLTSLNLLSPSSPLSLSFSYSSDFHAHSSDLVDEGHKLPRFGLLALGFSSEL